MQSAGKLQDLEEGSLSSSGPSRAPLVPLLCPSLLQSISQHNSQLRLSCNAPDPLQGEIVPSPRATQGFPFLQNTDPSLCTSHTAQELDAQQITWVDRCSLPIRNLHFLLGVWGQVFLAGQSFQKALLQHFHSTAFRAPSCWLCSQDTAACRREGHTREKRQNSGKQEH